IWFLSISYPVGLFRYEFLAKIVLSCHGFQCLILNLQPSIKNTEPFQTLLRAPANMMGFLVDPCRQFSVLTFKNLLQKIRKQRRLIFELAFAPLILLGLLNLINVNRAKQFPQCTFSPISISSTDPLDILSDFFCLSKVSCAENVDHEVLQSREDDRIDLCRPLSLIEIRQAFEMDNELYTNFSTVITEASEILYHISKVSPGRINFDGVQLSKLLNVNSVAVTRAAQLLDIPGGVASCFMNSTLKSNFFAKILRRMVMVADFSLVRHIEETLCSGSDSVDEYLAWNCTHLTAERVRRYMCSGTLEEQLGDMLLKRLDSSIMVDIVAKNFTGLQVTSDGVKRVFKSYITMRKILKKSKTRRLFVQLFKTISTATYSTEEPNERFKRFTDSFFCGRNPQKKKLPSDESAKKLKEASHYSSTKSRSKSRSAHQFQTWEKIFASSIEGNPQKKKLPSDESAKKLKEASHYSSTKSRSKSRSAHQFQTWEKIFASSIEDLQCAKLISKLNFDWARANKMIKFLRGQVFLIPDNPFIHEILSKINRRLETLGAARSHLEFWLDAFKLLLLPQHSPLEDVVVKLGIMLSNLNKSLDGLPDVEPVLSWLHQERKDLYTEVYVWNTLQNILKCWEVSRFRVQEVTDKGKDRAGLLDNLNLLLAKVHFELTENPIGWLNIKYGIDMSKTYAGEQRTRRLRGVPLPVRNPSTYLEHMELKNLIDYALMEIGISDVQVEGRRVYAHPWAVEQRSRPQLSRNVKEIIVTVLFVISLFAHNLGVYREVGYEREQHSREFLSYLGVSQVAYFAAWIASSLIWELASLCTVYFALSQYGILTYSNSACLAVLLFAYCISLCCMCCLVVTLLNGVQLSAVSLFLLDIVFLLPWLICQLATRDVTKYVRVISLTLPQSTMAWIVKEVLDLESRASGIQWTVFESNAVHSEETGILFHMLILLVQAFVYFLLTLYFDSILPDSYGLSKSWNFPFSLLSDCWKRSEEEVPVRGVAVKFTDVSTNGSDDVNRASSNNTLNFQICENSLFGILDEGMLTGRTLMLLLSGLLKPACGKVSWFHSSKRETVRIDPKSSVLFCPHYSILFYDLSFEENFCIYTSLLGLCCDNKKDELLLNELLARLKMKDRMKLYSQELSCASLFAYWLGEQKVLSVLIALQLGRRILVLDNPGLEACFKLRLKLWTLLSQKTKHTTIILSTTFPDVVDRFADGVAVVSGSNVQFFQTVSEFRDWLNIGYHICLSGFVADLPKNEPAWISVKKNFLRVLDRCFHQKELCKRTDAYVEFVVPRCSFDKLAAFCNYFEKKRSSIGCLRMEIFELRTKEALRNGLPNVRTLKAARNNRSLCDEVEMELLKPDAVPDVSYLKNKRPSTRAQFAAIWYRRFILFYRGHRRLFLMLLYPLLSIGIVLYLLEGMEHKHKVAVSTELGRTTVILRYTNITNLPYKTAHGVRMKVGVLNDDSSQRKNVNRSSRRDLRNAAAEGAIANDALSSKTKGCTYMTHMNGELSKLAIGETSWRRKLSSIFQRLNVTFIKLPQKEGRGDEDVELKPLLSYTVRYKHAMPELFQKCINDINNDFVNVVCRKHGRVHKPVWGTEKATAKLRSITERTAWRIALQDLCLAMVWCQGLCFICLCCCRVVMEDTTTGKKKLLFISSLSPPVYWLSNFIFDLIIYIGTVLLNGCFLFSSGLFIYKNSAGLLFNFIILTQAFGACMIALIYLMAKVLPSKLVGGVTVFLFFIFTGLVPAGFMLSAEYWQFLNAEELFYLGQPFDSDFPKEIGQIALLALPPYGLITALMELQVMARSLNEEDNDCTTELFRVPNLLWYTLLILSVETLLFIITGILGDLYSNRQLTWKKKSEPSEEAADVEQGKPTDAKEIHHYWDFKCEPDDGCPVNFKRKTVIENVSICLPYGVCVGVFGHQRSGKSTLCQLLAAMETATSGKVTFHSISDTNPALDQIGYIPRESQLDADLTVMDTLTFYAKVRCIQESVCTKIVCDILCAFDLTSLMNRRVEFISEAEKKRLSLAVAFVGGPSVVILDEPTKYLTFQECRRLYQAISSMLDNRTTILIASENTDFLRCVCRDINVINNGQIAEFGSLTNQEWKYGPAYIVEIKLLRREQISWLTKFIKERMPHAELCVYSTTIVAKIPQLSSDASPILIMQLADSISRSFAIDRISIYLNSLNDILEAS
ncbi:hypothetical protein M513_01577, partial [Trichuris suis]